MAPAPGYEVIVSHNPNFKPFMNLASAFRIIVFSSSISTKKLMNYRKYFFIKYYFLVFNYIIFKAFFQIKILSQILT